MKKAMIYLMLATFIIVSVACNANTSLTSSTGEEITIKHQLGETKVVKNPKKVVVFDFGILDTLDHLGIEVVALPKSGKIPKYLSKYQSKKYENVGTLKEPDFEKISELGPDLILISTRQQPLYKEFQKIAPTIFIGIDTKNYFPSFENNMKTVGKIFGREKEVEQELTNINKLMDETNQKAKENPKKGLIILANDDKVSAYGSKSRFGIIHDHLGVQPVDTNIKASTHGQNISFEYIVEKDPEYLYVVDRAAVVGGKTSAKQLVENELVKKTKAYKSGNIVYLDPEMWYLSGGGLHSVNEMIKAINQSLK